MYSTPLAKNWGPFFHSTRPNYHPSSLSNTSNMNQFPSVDAALYNPDSTSNVYIRLLPPHANNDSLFSLTSCYGTILSVRTLKSSHSQNLDENFQVYDEEGMEVPKESKCSGIGFVLFSDIEGAERCVRGLHSSGFIASFAKESNSLKVKKLADSESSNLYLSNLPLHYNEESLIQLFYPLQVKCVRLLRESDKDCKMGTRATGPGLGTGFCRLIDRESCQLAIDQLNMTWLPGCLHPIKIRFADTVEQKKFKAELTKSRLALERQPSPSYFSSNSSSPSGFTQVSYSTPSSTPDNSPSTSPSSFSSFSTNSTVFSEVNREKLERKEELQKKYGLPPRFDLIPRPKTAVSASPFPTAMIERQVQGSHLGSDSAYHRYGEDFSSTGSSFMILD